MLKSYQAIYSYGRLCWLDQAPPADQEIPMMVVAEVVESPTTSLINLDEDDNYDPSLNAFLSFLDKAMAEHPELILPMDEQELQEIATLVEGVELD